AHVLPRPRPVARVRPRRRAAAGRIVSRERRGRGRAGHPQQCGPSGRPGEQLGARMAEIILESIAHSYEARRGASDEPVRGKRPVWALRDVELRWRDGGAYALLGPSGCGKTTLL